ncbi:AraC family transcriptional regulator [Hwangdonia seohaensis]|uniref:Helix-turn-helix transcriptional regulator n=1 Tax=Hwangdonia seohaensis TaxID=1240727 RepID=A0ABW3RF58_9FLAO|nr:AraC family transcriptional regulator [Hwangdonia seohaensis]
MIEIEIKANNSKEILEDIQNHIGGTILELWSECTLIVDNDLAEGSIRFIPYDWGVNLLDYNITFKDEIRLKMHADAYNPIRFIYALSGSFKHRFGVDNREELVEPYHSLIFTNKSSGINYIHFPKDTKLEINVIQIIRKRFLKKRTTNVSTLNKKLYEIFLDTDHENRFIHYGTLNLKMADLVKKTRNLKAKGMLRVLKIEAKVYEILTLHIQRHNKLQQGVPLPTSLIKSELIKVRKLGEAILKNPAKNYSLEQLASDTGLSQAKLQDGFKFLYTRTVTEYIRHVRLESARNLILTTDLNISQIVYTIGFTSRSYFSKIFKEKYDITPNEYKKQIVTPIAV